MEHRNHGAEEIGPRVLVTGGSGFFGRVLTRTLLDAGLHVRVLDMRSHEGLDPRAELQRGDLCDERVLASAVRGCTTVFHTASLINLCGVASGACRERVHAVNVGGTKALLRASVAEGTKSFVYTSSNNVVVDRAITNGDESEPYARRHTDLYTETKILAEKLVLAAGKTTDIRTCALRPGGIWGPGVGGLVVDNVLDALARGLLVARIGAGAPSDNTHVDNLASAHVLAARALCETPNLVSGEAYFITDGEPMDPLEWFKPLFDELGVAVPTTQLSTRLMYALGYVSEWVARFRGSSPVLTRAGVLKATRAHSFSIAKAKTHLGYEPCMKSAEGLRAYAPAARTFMAARGFTAAH